jgi:hypothetical protein
LLLPFYSPSRDGLSSYKLEIRLTHHGSGGLFIGANMFLFALMNPAPAELLHLLVNAALQPIGYTTPIQILQHLVTPGWEDATRAPPQIFLEVRPLNISSTSQKKRRQ